LIGCVPEFLLEAPEPLAPLLFTGWGMKTFRSPGVLLDGFKDNKVSLRCEKPVYFTQPEIQFLTNKPPGKVTGYDTVERILTKGFT
jgi:hypothetical protein